MLSADIWQLCVGRHLTMRDLCNLMQVSSEWFSLWVADRAWERHRQRLVHQFPQLASVFESRKNKNSDEHKSKGSIKSNANKQRKMAWITPRRGIWRVFKMWIGPSCTFTGFRTLCKIEETHPLVYAALSTIIPHADGIVEWDLCKVAQHADIWDKKKKTRSRWTVTAKWKEADRKLIFTFMSAKSAMKCEYNCDVENIKILEQLYLSLSIWSSLEVSPWVIAYHMTEAWKATVYERKKPRSPWTPTLAALLK